MKMTSVGRVVEVADDRRHLFVSRGFLVVRSTGDDAQELGQVPLDDIAAVIANAHGLSYTNNLLIALAERGAPLVVCAANHNACGMLWPIEGHHRQALRFDAQIAAAKPLRKRLWSDVVRAKIRQQATVLTTLGKPAAPLTALLRKVRSGDPNNIEAQAARRYWVALFGSGFRRDQNAGGINGLLNYGYSVMRAATARAVIAAGLHPTLGIHHQNAGNSMRLVDDLVEPFRPLIDLKTVSLFEDGTGTVTPDAKRSLVNTLYDDLMTEAGRSPVMSCIQRLATSLAQVYLGEREDLTLPHAALPIALVASIAADRSTC